MNISELLFILACGIILGFVVGTFFDWEKIGNDKP